MTLVLSKQEVERALSTDLCIDAPSFAAVGARAYEAARSLGLGHELPTDWFAQTVHP